MVVTDRFHCIVNWALRNTIQWNLNRNLYVFIQENAFQNVVRKLAAIVSRLQCVKSLQSVVTMFSFHFRHVHSNDFCFSCQNCLSSTLNSWEKESIGLRKCTWWPLWLSVTLTQGRCCDTDYQELVCLDDKVRPLIQSLQNLVVLSP